MPRLKLDDRTYEHDDGTWTRIDLDYCHPWENADKADITVSIAIFSKEDGRGFDFAKPPSNSVFFHLDEMAIHMLWGFLAAAKDLMPRQWEEYRAQMDEDKARTPDKAA